MDTKKEKRAIEYLRAFEPKTEPYYLCYSGGKDSDCIRILASLSGVKHDIVHNLTTVDAPETIKYIKSIPDVIIDRPPLTMWELIVKNKMPPTRLTRYCCEGLKERGGKGRVKITGVRWAESNNRKNNSDVVKVIGKPKSTQKLAEEMGVDYDITEKGGIVLNNDNDADRRFVERCYRTTSTMLNPIVDWSDEDVWDFLHHYGCESNPLYKCGRSRIGCIGCPMANGKGQKEHFAMYPKYKEQYIRTFEKMLDARRAVGMKIDAAWRDGEAVMKWWIGDNPLQCEFDLDDLLRGDEGDA